MYQTSEEFGNLIQQDSRTFYALLYFDGNTITDGISEITIEGGSNSEDDFSIGSAVSRYAKIKMTNPAKRIEGKEITIKIGMMVGESIEYVPMGYYTAEKPKTDESQITVTAYDRMMKTERVFSADGIAETTDTVTVLNAISRITGVTVVTDGLTAISMQRPDSYTCREILGYISQMYGGFAICNRQGQIEIKTYIDSDYPVDTSRYWDTFEHHDVTEKIEKITCYIGKDSDGNDVSVSVGSGTREISFSNPFMTQEMLDNVWKVLSGYEYMPGSIKFMGDPRVDPWDVLTVSDLNGTTNMMPANPILTKQGEYDESKPEFFPKGKIKLTPSGCVGYDNLDEDTKQRINNKTSDYSEYIPFYGKKIVGIGDSIMVGIKSDGSAIIDGIGKNGLPCTDQGYQINSTGGFLGELRKKYPSINVVNMGVGSTTIQRNDNVNVNKVYKCIMDRIDSIPDDADIIILEGGINDFFHASKGCVLGTYKDNLYKYPTSAKYENGAYSYVEFAVDTTLDASTFCGALEIALTKILVRFVGKPFIYVIPHNPSASADIDTFFNSAKEICEKYGVPVVDIRKAGCMPRIYTLSGKTDGTSAFTQDGVHPNSLGYQLHYVPAIASTLKSIM